jgi:hypothetical protein
MAKKKPAPKGKPAAPKKAKPASAPAPARSSKTTTIEISLTGEAADQVKEMVGIAERIDDGGREILLNAARAVETKGKIETFNRELNVVADRAARKRRELAAPEYQVLIERTEDDFFIIQLDSARIFFNRQEMREITRFCHAAESPANGARRMFRWFEKERSDLLVDAGINSEKSPYLINLYEQVIATYKVKS